MVDTEALQKKVAKGPPWLIPAIIGGGFGLFTLWRRKNSGGVQYAPAPVAAVGDGVTPGGSDYADIQGLLAQQAQQQAERDAAAAKNAPDYAALFGAIADGQTNTGKLLSEQQAASMAAQNAANAANQSAWAKILDAISKGFTSSPVTAPTAPSTPSTPANPGPPSAPSPTTPNPAPTGGTAVTGADWAALASYLGGVTYGLGYGGIYAGFPIRVTWPASAGRLPPSGNFPTLNTPVAYNSAHDTWRTAGANAFSRTLRWTADEMAANPNQNATAIWDHMLGRLMRDIGPYNGHENEWYGTGFDLGSVKDSPYLDGNGTPNPAWRG